MQSLTESIDQSARSCRRKLAGIQRSLRNDTISRNCRNLQNRIPAATEIAIRFRPKILLKCSVRKTGPKYRYPTIGLDYGGYKSSFSLNHKFNHYDRRIRFSLPHSNSTQLLREAAGV
jgi:hypothetical protein